MQSKSCPISLIRVDANIARIGAFYVALFLLVFLVSHEVLFIYFLTLDFATRIFLKKEFSLIYTLASFTKKLLHLETSMIDAAPKKLAMFFGLAFVSAILVANFFSLTALIYLLSGVLLGCVVLEVLFSYCLGCEIYYLYKKITMKW